MGCDGKQGRWRLGLRLCVEGRHAVAELHDGDTGGGASQQQHMANAVADKDSFIAWANILRTARATRAGVRVA